MTPAYTLTGITVSSTLHEVDAIVLDTTMNLGSARVDQIVFHRLPPDPLHPDLATFACTPLALHIPFFDPTVHADAGGLFVRVTVNRGAQQLCAASHPLTTADRRILFELSPRLVPLELDGEPLPLARQTGVRMGWQSSFVPSATPLGVEEAVEDVVRRLEELSTAERPVFLPDAPPASKVKKMRVPHLRGDRRAFDLMVSWACEGTVERESS